VNIAELGQPNDTGGAIQLGKIEEQEYDWGI